MFKLQPTQQIGSRPRSDCALRLYLPAGTTEFETTKVIALGRDPSNCVVLSGSAVSGFHCHIEQRGHDWVIIDNHSTNGTYLDGLRVHRAPLPPHGELLIGHTRIPFSCNQHSPEPPDFFGIIGNSRAMQRVFREIQVVARSSEPVLISGETGSGKELVARAIHRASPRNHARLLSRNCGAIPEGLADSELFGSIRGAFSQAIDKPGVFEGADGGTVFLDELGELPLSIQAKLLRAIQEQTIVRLGDLSERDVDFRLVSATHKTLYAMVRQGLFREDLFHRISVFTIELPPLRERHGDIPLLINHILQKKGISISDEAMELLQRLPWPGNVRQLNNTLTRAAAFCARQCIEIRDLYHMPKQFRASLHHSLAQKKDRRFRSLDNEHVRRETMMVWEQAGRSVSRAAALLGIAKSTMHSRKARYQLPERGTDE